MESDRRSDERPLRFRREGGYTMVEMIIATAVAIVVGLGIYAIFNSQRKVAESQRIYNDLQTSCGFAMDQVKRELLRAGYRPKDPANPVSVAGANTVSFEYWDERASADAPFDDAHFDRHTQVHFTLEANGDLVRRFKRWHTGSNRYEPTSPFPDLDAPYKQTLAKDVQALNFQYFRQNNVGWDPDPDNNPLTPPPYADIRSVIVSLECRASKANPIHTDASRGIASTTYARVRLQSEVRLRNIGVEANPRDTQPPATPGSLPGTGKGIRAWDPGLCSPVGTVCGAPGTACASLELAWDANTESDLAGYNLYYGLASNSYSNRVRIARGPGAAGERIYFTLNGLQATTACDTAQVTYFIRIEAFDRSGNPSDRSAEITGPRPPATVPVTNLRSEDAAIAANDNDTAINPTPPPAPTGFSAGTPADNQIRLSWTAPPVDGLVGYRLYRSQTGAGFAPVGAVAGIGNCIADERTLDVSATGFLDTGVFLDPAILTGCTQYHYKLAAVHCDGCLPEALTNFAAASSTTVDTTPPPCPTISSRPRWKRIALRLDNPLRSAVPDFAYSRIWQSKADYPQYNDNGTPGNPADDTVSGTLIPDTQRAGDPGTFTADGTVSVNFDSESAARPATPELDITADYYFLAVGYDHCGNVCSPVNSTASQTKGEQCADDPVGPPPAVTGPPAATGGCGENLTFSWTNPVTDEFAGVHLFRCPREFWSSCGPDDWTELTSGPLWGSTFTDTKAQGLQEGSSYSYRIRATDCYYEDHYQTWDGTVTGGGDPANDPKDNYSDNYIEKLYIGRLQREDMFPGPSARVMTPVSAAADRVSVESDTYLAAAFPSAAGTGIRTILVEEEILSCSSVEGPAAITVGVPTASAFTDCVRGAQGTTAAPHDPGKIVLPYPASRPIQATCGDLAEVPPSFQHNTVEFRVRNTAAGPLRITTLSPSWQNTNAFLQNIKLGDDNTTPATTVWNDSSATLTHGAAGGTLTLSNAVIYALDQKVPVAMTFKNADGSVSLLDNMREEQLDLDYICRNESTGDASCADRATVYVPLGPYIYGATQDMPIPGTMAWAVPGAQGYNAMNTVVVPGLQQVNVYVNVSDSDYAGVREVRLYYYVDAFKAYSAPPPLDPTAQYPNLPPYQRLDLVPVAGNQWRTPPSPGNIPASNDANVWFFIVAVDNNGNFDREPEPGGGAFQYYQRPYDVCYDTPRAPTLTGSYTSTSVSLSWTAPLQNTDGSSWTDAGGYLIYRKTQAGAPVKVAQVGPTTLTFTDSPPNLGSETYSYYVSAFDTCTPTANESAASNWYTECHGAPTCAVSLHSSRNPLWSGDPGDTFTIDLSVCTRQNGTPGEHLFAQACSGADANPVLLVEDGDTGSFRIDAGTYLGSEMKTWLALPASPGNLDLRVNETDTITVRGYRDTAGGGWDTTCDTTLACSASLGVVGNPCVGPVRPSAPTNLTIAISNGDCNGGKSGPVNLSWTASATGPVSEYRVYRCIGSGCTPAQIGTSTTTSYTDTDAGASLKANVFTYEVRAVNLACPSNPLESAGVSRAETCN